MNAQYVCRPVSRLTICQITPGHPQVKQLSPAALECILDIFCARSTQAASLRAVITESLQPATSTSHPIFRPNRTKQAFAEACRSVIAEIDHWIADLEASFVLGTSGGASSRMVPGVSAASSPLLLQVELEEAFGSILDHLSGFLPHVNCPTQLLNTMYSTIEAARPSTKVDEVRFLVDILVQTSAPMWSMLGDWLNRGMSIPLSLTAIDQEQVPSNADDECTPDDEFFIKRDLDVSWADEDFWEAGFVDGAEGWPVWLSHGDTKEEVMEGGKAKGLLRGLVGSIGEADEWQSLPNGLKAAQEVSPTSAIDIAEAISTYLTSICQLSRIHLRRVLEEECGLQEHLDAIEGIMYMRGYVVMDEWTDWLFTQVPCHEPDGAKTDVETPGAERPQMGRFPSFDRNTSRYS